MTSERDQSYVGHIVDSIDLVLRYVAGDPAALSREGAIRDAVVWRLETIGEAAGHLSDDLRSRHPEIPWAAIRAFRNIAAHGYLTLRPERIQEIVDEHLEPLREALSAEL